MRTIVTTAYNFTDIDGYACCIAYADLLRKNGEDAVTVLPGELNESVVSEVQKWPVTYETEYEKMEDDVFALLDISNREVFPKFVEIEKVRVLFDHHFGFESEWKARLGGNALIEKIGSCATFIVEEAVKLGLLEKLEPSSRNLLFTAIFANSLNLQAKITDVRDRQAYETLSRVVNLPPNWQEAYFMEMQKGLLADPYTALVNDNKGQEINGQRWFIGQLEMWDGNAFIEKEQRMLDKFLAEVEVKNSFVNIPSIKEAKTRVVCKNEETKEQLMKVGLLPDCTFNGLRLRKEWIKLLIDA